MKAARPDARNSILDAAQHIAATRGAGHVTLDAVAKESGLSKGGVLYHFPNKHALISGMLERLLSEEDTERRAHEEALAGARRPTLRAMLLARISDGGPLKSDSDTAMAILAAAAEEPRLLDPAREHARQLCLRVRAEGGDEDMALLLWAAADGLMFLDLLSISPLDAADRERLLRRLLTLAEELS